MVETITMQDLDLVSLKKRISEIALTCIHPPVGSFKSSFVIPTADANPGEDDQAEVADRSLSGSYLQMYDWDACFFSQASKLLQKPKLPLNVIDNFLSFQEKSGFVPRTVSPNRIWDKGDLCKPFLAQTLYWYLKNIDNKFDCSPYLTPLKKYLDYFQSHRKSKNGLFTWRNVLESGVDNNLALIAPLEASKDENADLADFPDGRLFAVDLNAYLACEYQALAMLADHSNNAELHHVCAEESAKIKDAIENILFDKEDGLYYNYDPSTKSFVKIKAWTSLLPVFLGLTTTERANSIIKNYVLSKQHFLSNFGLTSLSLSELLSNQSPRGLYGRAIVCNWQGPVWVLPNVLACRGLIKYGYNQEAKDLAIRILKTLETDLKAYQHMHENYDAHTGLGLWAENFVSWNVLSLELIEFLENN